MNDNPKTGFFARIVDWFRGVRTRMSARSYDAPPRTFWWIMTRVVAPAFVVLCFTHALAYRLNSSAGRVHASAYAPAQLVSLLPPVDAPDPNDYVSVKALAAVKTQLAEKDALLAQNDEAILALDAENADMRKALASLQPRSKVAAAPPPAPLPVKTVSETPITGVAVDLSVVVPPKPVPAVAPTPAPTKTSGHKPAVKWCGSTKDWLCKVEKLVSNPAAAVLAKPSSARTGVK